jgi:hypothetical protein
LLNLHMNWIFLSYFFGVSHIFLSLLFSFLAHIHFLFIFNSNTSHFIVLYVKWSEIMIESAKSNQMEVLVIFFYWHYKLQLYNSAWTGWLDWECVFLYMLSILILLKQYLKINKSFYQLNY